MLLLFCSGLIAGAEAAYLSLKPSDILSLHENKKKAGHLVSKHLEDKESLMATILISNIFIKIAAITLFYFLTEQIRVFPSHYIVEFVLKIAVIIAVILLFSEILPKIYARLYAQKVALLMAGPLNILLILTKPLSRLIIYSSNAINKQLTKKEKGFSMNDISQALELSDDEITEGKEILRGIASFGTLNVDEIMTSRVDVVDLDIENKFSRVIDVIIESGYSRIPVYDKSPDEVKGILYVKDLLPHLEKGDSFKWQDLIREAYYVPDTKRINDLLQEFKAHKIHMAVVVDEYGGTSGIVTLEDILEEIVGDIIDEMDEEDINYTTLNDGSYIFDGKTLLRDFYKITGIPEEPFEEISAEVDTVAGLLLEIKGDIPEKHEIIEFANYKFTVLSVDRRHIKKIKISQF